MNTIYDVIIVGSGPAGTSAALYAKRGGLSPLVIGKDGGSLAKAALIENYYGLEEPVSGQELLRRGMAGAKRLGIPIVEDEVFSIMYNDTMTGFNVSAKGGTYEGTSVILAAGSARKTLPIPGLTEREGRGVSYCAICDAFFYRGKDVAVLGNSIYALHEAEVLLPHAFKVTILTNGLEPMVAIPDTIAIDKRPLLAIEGDGKVESVLFADGENLPISGFFVALGTAGSTDFARKLGVIIDNNHIVTDENMATNVPGFYAAGDCTGGLLQVAKAVADGAQAGLSVIKYIRNK